MIIPLFSKLDKGIQDEIMLHARIKGASYAAKQYAAVAGMKEKSLYILLSRKLKNEKPIVQEPKVVPEKTDGRRKVREPERELTAEEEALLDKLEKGEVGLTEMSRLVARQVFTKMLKNPNDFKFIDFFRTELLRQKDEENKIKDKWAGELINRMFAGKLPPRICPNCGADLVPDSPLLTGTIIDESTDGTDA